MRHRKDTRGRWKRIRTDGICKASGKKRFDRLSAELLIARARSMGRQEIRAYRCPECGFFHTTSKPLKT